MPVSQEFADHILDTLEPMGAVSARRMMGGLMLYLDDLAFGMVSDDVLYLKVGDNNIAEFEAAGSGPFTYMRGDREFALKTHWRAPEELLDDGDELLAWARGSVDAALAADKARPQKKAKKKSRKKPRGKSKP